MSRQLSTDWTVGDITSIDDTVELNSVLDDAWSHQVKSLGLDWSALSRSAYAVLQRAHATPGYEAVPAKWRRKITSLYDFDVDIKSVIAGSSGVLGKTDAYDDLLMVLEGIKRITPFDLQERVFITSLVRPGFDFTASGARSRRAATPSFHAIGHAVDLQGSDAATSRRVYDILRADQSLRRMAQHMYYDIGRDGRGVVHSRRPIVHYDFKPSDEYVKKLAESGL